jgi:hypothetical protein
MTTVADFQALLKRIDGLEQQLSVYRDRKQTAQQLLEKTLAKAQERFGVDGLEELVAFRDQQRTLLAEYIAKANATLDEIDGSQQ